MDRADFRFSMPLRVRWSEADPQGIVFNGHYLNFADVGVTEYYRALRAAAGVKPGEGLDGSEFLPPERYSTTRHQRCSMICWIFICGSRASAIPACPFWWESIGRTACWSAARLSMCMPISRHVGQRPFRKHSRRQCAPSNIAFRRSPARPFRAEPQPGASCYRAAGSTPSSTARRALWLA